MASHRRTGAARVAFVAVALSIVLVAGCLETEVPVGPPDQATVNRAYVGDWRFTDDNGNVSLYRVRNFNGREYYVELEEPGGDPGGASGDRPVVRMSGFVIPVKGVDFAHLRTLQDDGSLPGPYSVTRVGIKDGRLEFRELSESFFEKRDIGTSEKLRRVIEQNLDNRAMYEEEGVTGTRIGP